MQLSDSKRASKLARSIAEVRKSSFVSIETAGRKPAELYIPHLRLYNQRISHTNFTKPEEVVEHMGALQGQDYLMSLWAIGLRTKSATEKDIEQAVIDKKIVRTWPMRRTLHWVSAKDVHWMVGLSSEKLIKQYGAHMPQLGLTDEMLKTARNVVTKLLSDGKPKTRDEIYRHFTEAHVPVDQSRGIHILWRLGQEALVCFGPREGKQQTFVLLDQWLPKKRDISRDEAIAEVVLKYFASHGPATIHDLAWWSGLTIADVKRGIAAVAGKLIEHKIEGKSFFTGLLEGKIVQGNSAYLLPSFDEYFISYKDRSHIIDDHHKEDVNRGLNGFFNPIIVIQGRVEGTWKREVKKGTVLVHPAFFKNEQADIEGQVRRFREFLGLT